MDRSGVLRVLCVRDPALQPLLLPAIPARLLLTHRAALLPQRNGTPLSVQLL